MLATGERVGTAGPCVDQEEHIPTKARPLGSDEGWQLKGESTCHPSTGADLAVVSKSDRKCANTKCRGFGKATSFFVCRFCHRATLLSIYLPGRQPVSGPS